MSKTKRDSSLSIHMPGPGLYNLNICPKTDRKTHRPGFNSSEVRKNTFVDATQSPGVGSYLNDEKKRHLIRHYVHKSELKNIKTNI